MHDHPPLGPAQAAITAGLTLAAVLEAERQLATALEPLYPVLRQANHEPAATELNRVQQELRIALVAAGKAVQAELERMAAGATPAAEV